MVKMFPEDDDEAQHNEELLWSLKKIPNTKLKTPKQEIPIDYNFQKFSLFRTPKFNMLLKASSLFENSILFENEFIEIQCVTEKRLQNNLCEVILELKYQPKRNNFKITTNFPSIANLEVHQKFKDKVIRKEESQFLVMKMKKLHFPEFIKLDMHIDFNEENRMSYHIPIPFSINKFCESLPISQETIDMYFSKNNVVLSRIVTWNVEIIETFH